MSDHIHLMAIPEEPQSLVMALRRTQGRYALNLNSRRHRVGHLWQNRFYSCALDETHSWPALRYVELNPVRAQIVSRPEGYAWSSASAHVGANTSSKLPDWQFYTTSGGRERWIALLAEPEELAAIRPKASALAPNPCSPSRNNPLRTISPSLNSQTRTDSVESVFLSSGNLNPPKPVIEDGQTRASKMIETFCFQLFDILSGKAGLKGNR